MTLRTILTSASAAIVMMLGIVHLFYTFWGTKLFPVDPSVAEAMKSARLVITDETTTWKAWTGFNATHSSALILFGLIYGYLSLFHPTVLYNSLFLEIVGLIMLISLAILCWNYFFSVPLIGVSIALVFYLAGIITSRVGN